MLRHKRSHRRNAPTAPNNGGSQNRNDSCSTWIAIKMEWQDPARVVKFSWSIGRSRVDGYHDRGSGVYAGRVAAPSGMERRGADGEPWLTISNTTFS